MSTCPVLPPSGSHAASCINSAKPWAPFRTRADFEFVEEGVTQCLSEGTINKLLEGFHGRWAKKSKLTLHNYVEYKTSLSAARKFSVQVPFTQLLTIYTHSL